MDYTWLNNSAFFSSKALSDSARLTTQGYKENEIKQQGGLRLRTSWPVPPERHFPDKTSNWSACEHRATKNTSTLAAACCKSLIRCAWAASNLDSTPPAAFNPAHLVSSYYIPFPTAEDPFDRAFFLGFLSEDFNAFWALRSCLTQSSSTRAMVVTRCRDLQQARSVRVYSRVHTYFLNVSTQSSI